MTSKMRSILVFIVLLLAFGAVTQAMAQSSVTKIQSLERETAGAVTAMTTTTMTINGRVFNIAQAEISGTINVGTVVKVHYSVALDGTLVVREVRPAVRQVILGNGDDLNDDHGQDDLNDDLNDDHGQDIVNHDVNDDHGQDDLNDDLNDDHGQDGVNHDVNDDHGQDNSDDHSDNSSHVGDSNQDDDSGHHGGGDD